MKETLIKLSIRLNLPIEVVSQAYKAYWRFIRSKIEELPLKDDLDEETFSKLRTSFNIPKLGKIHCTYPRYKVLKNINRKIKDDKYQKNKTTG